MIFISPIPCTLRRGPSLLMLPIVPEAVFNDMNASQLLQIWVVEPLSRIHEKCDDVAKVVIYDECSDVVSDSDPSEATAWFALPFERALLWWSLFWLWSLPQSL